jgi:hypothetical protein
VLLAELRRAAADAFRDRAVSHAFADRMRHTHFMLALLQGELNSDAPPAISLAVEEGLQL